MKHGSLLEDGTISKRRCLDLFDQHVRAQLSVVMRSIGGGWYITYSVCLGVGNSCFFCPRIVIGPTPEVFDPEKTMKNDTMVSIDWS